MVSIIYANRNRDTKRIRNSLISLKKQTVQGFEVIFVDYGSETKLVNEYELLFQEFDFVRFFSLEVPQLLWNKSKALNYGFKKATKPFIFVSDIDLIFHPHSVEYFCSVKEPKKFFLFPLNYLDQKESWKLDEEYGFDDLKPERKGYVNGMVLAETSAIFEVWGLDEFFHFYGAEDEDLFGRLENAGNEKVFCDKDFFLHNWHLSFSGSEEKLLTTKPRIRNAMRINQRHFQNNMLLKLIRPLRQETWGEIVPQEKSELLSNPTKFYKISNVRAWVEHFLNEELPSLGGEIVKAEFYEDQYFRSNKHKIKKILGKQTQPYCTMKEVNDKVLKTILFRYRDGNYSFIVNEDLKKINFTIEL